MLLSLFTRLHALLTFCILLPTFAQSQSLTITPTGNSLYLKYESQEPKNFMYSALPYKNEVSAALNHKQNVADTYNTTKLRGYFSVKTDKMQTEAQFATSIKSENTPPKRVFLYVVGTSSYQNAMRKNIKTFKNNTYPKGSAMEMTVVAYIYTLHTDKTLSDFVQKIQADDAVIFCHQDTFGTALYTEKQKQRDGNLLLNTPASHILRLYEHFYVKTAAVKGSEGVASNEKLWFEGNQDIFIDHTETPASTNAEPLPYFIQQFAKAEGRDWKTIIKNIKDNNTTIKAWADGKGLH
jgi:hypothetical protein